MLVYKKEWADNLEIRKKLKTWRTAGLINDAEFQGVTEKYFSGYHESTVWVRAGMFLFMLLIILASSLLINIAFRFDILDGISILCIFLGILFYTGAEFAVREKKYFRSGITDALLYASLALFSLGIVALLTGKSLDFSLDPLIYLVCLLPAFIFASIRFADAFLALCSYACLLNINVLLIIKLGVTGHLLLPFECMALSICVYGYFKKLRKKDFYRFWKRPSAILEIAGLITLYASGNYLVVRKLSEQMLGVVIQPGQDMQFSIFFYAYTLIVPLLYLWQGLRKKDVVLIRLGLLLIVAGVLTIRIYHSFLPLETAMIAGGSSLILAAWLGINYLKTPKHGMSYQQDDARMEAFSAISSVVISQAGKGFQNDLNQKPDIFKGGSSGGGGAGGGF